MLFRAGLAIPKYGAFTLLSAAVVLLLKGIAVAYLLITVINVLLDIVTDAGMAIVEGVGLAGGEDDAQKMVRREQKRTGLGAERIRGKNGQHDGG